MIKVVVAGATGKLGTLVCKLVEQQEDMQLVGGIVSANGGHVGNDIAPGVRTVGPDRLTDALGQADVYLDVTSPIAAEQNLRQAIPTGVNCVIGTTGFDERFVRELRDMFIQQGSSSVLTANFSVGVNVFWKQCEQLARALKDYEVEIIEVHHDKKKDSPSGTAVKAAQVISEATSVDKMVYGRHGLVGARGREIGIHAVRIGDVVGEHTVIFAGNKERIELTHRAHSREAFAEGSLAAIRYVAGRRDGQVHSMAEVLGL